MLPQRHVCDRAPPTAAEQVGEAPHCCCCPLPPLLLPSAATIPCHLNHHPCHLNHRPSHPSPATHPPTHPPPHAGKFDQVRINFANPDMVGHTGDLAATVSCCELVDRCVQVRVVGWWHGGGWSIVCVRVSARGGERSGKQRGCGQQAVLPAHRPPAPSPTLTAAAGAAGRGRLDERALPGHLRPRQRRRHGAGGW